MTTHPRDAEFEDALTTIAEFSPSALSRLMLDVATRWVRTPNLPDGALLTALHALQEADADLAPAADSPFATLTAAVGTLNEWHGVSEARTQADADGQAQVAAARSLLTEVRDRAARLLNRQ